MDFTRYFDSDTYAVAETAAGPMVCFARDTGVSDSLLRFGEYAAGELKVYRALLSPGDVFVDVGANIGAISAALHRDRAGYVIWAFEPQAAFHAVATANLMTAPGARVLPYAVGSKNRLIEVPEINTRSQTNYGGIPILAQTERMLPVPAVRLDSFLATRAPKPRLIKVDVEGLEADVIAGIAGLLHDRLVLSVEADRPTVMEQWWPMLQDHGMTCFLLFFGNVSSGNPRYDRAEPKCRTRFPHVVAFAGEPDAAFLAEYGGMRLDDLETYRTRMWPAIPRPAAAGAERESR